ncbi:MAG: phage tail tip lysozyme, partial [Acutalibacteraceae bacterium]|nr:phage tail tip lysozyme [Acutalibacteraceae bacterium]
DSYLKKDMSKWFSDESTAKETPKPSSELARRQRIVADVFRRAGFDEDSIRAFVGNLTYESGGGLNPFENTGDKGRAFGIAQWQKGGRADKLLRRMSGVSDVDTALRIQAQYAVDEVMNSPEFKGLRPENFNRLSYEQKVDKVLNEFEAPHKMYRRGGIKSSYEARRDIGLQSDILEGSTSSGFSGNYTSTVNIYGFEQDRLQSVSGEAIKDSHADIIRQSNISPSGV